MLPSGQKLTLDLRPPSPSRVCTVPSASAIFKCILEVVFGEGVQHRLHFYLDHLSCVKIAAFQFYLQSRKKKSKMVGRRLSCCFRSKIRWRKKKCETVRCSEVTASSFVAKVRGEVFTYFHAVATKWYSSMRN
jgi:hypothetical protein